MSDLFNSNNNNNNNNNIFAFDSILGNHNTISYFKNLFINNNISHAYILDGYSKVGKEAIATEFARLLFCENLGRVKNCNCLSCTGILSNNNPDFFILKTKKSSISVDDIRNQVLKNLETKPFKFKYKVFIIKGADKMTIQAQNALLKTIEEPPSFAIFILLSQNYEYFLPTILSRCMLFKIERLKESQIHEYLLQKGIPEQEAIEFANYSQGSLGKALELLQSENFLDFKSSILDDISKLHKFKSLDDLNIAYMYSLIEKYEKLKSNSENKNKDKNKNKNTNFFNISINDILDIYILVYRDSLIFKQTQDLKYVVQKDMFILIKNLSRFSVLSLTSKINAILEAKLQLKKNANFNMVMECLFIKLIDV